MMALFSLIFFAVLLAIATGVIWAFWSLIALIFAKRKVRAFLIGFPVSVIAVVLMVIVLIIMTNRPSSVFEREFGFAPPSDVVFVNSYNFSLGDSGSTYLQFNASPTTIATIIQSAGLVQGDPNYSVTGRPKWFGPPQAAGQIYYRDTSRFPNGGFASEMRILTVEPSAGQAWYEFSGID